MLARVLSRFDSPVEVLTASSGEEALAKISGQMIDILITDFMMPGLNGLELIERLKGEQRPAHVILITAYDTPGLAITARRLNVQDYLVKPVQPEKIRSIVARVIEEIRPQKTAAPTPAKHPFKILIADDYPDNLRLLSTRLRSEGYTFIPAWDGEETLVKLREEQPDLLLLDVNMPKKDGFEVLAEMRADPSLAHIPVIIITAARIGPKDIREGLSLGADDYIMP
jgi:CheY-like chemotaxis protein